MRRATVLAGVQAIVSPRLRQKFIQRYANGQRQKLVVIVGLYISTAGRRRAAIFAVCPAHAIADVVPVIVVADTPRRHGSVSVPVIFPRGAERQRPPVTAQRLAHGELQAVTPSVLKCAAVPPGVQHVLESVIAAR